MKKIILAVLVMILIAGCVSEKPRPHSKYYAGDWRNFRGNIIEAEDIVVYPNEGAVRYLLLKSSIEKVQIAYIPNESENAFYFVSSFEISNKLSIIYRNLFQGSREVDFYTAPDNSSCLVFFLRDIPNVFSEKCFKSVPVNSIDEASEIAKEKEPVILLLGPSQTDRTIVDLKEYVVTAEGKDFTEVNRTYTDLDLSVAKLILTLMED